MSVESSFSPIAESVAGTKGLLQVIPRFHPEKFVNDAETSVFDPAVNIRVGTRILKEYMQRRGGLEAGRQLYNGAANDPDSVYAGKVLSEKRKTTPARGSRAATGGRVRRAHRLHNSRVS